MARIINVTDFGIVFKCSCCQKIHIEFNNINFNFTEEQYRNFSEYLNNLDGEYWEEKNRFSVFKRKIRIPLDKSSFCLMLNKEELVGLRQLLSVPYASVENDLAMQMTESWCLN